MLPFGPYYAAGLPYVDWLARFATPDQRERWARAYDAVRLTPDQHALVASWTREMRVICLAGAWCGDCVHQCPHLQRIAEANPKIRLRFLDRDDQAALADQLTIAHGKRVPVVIFLSEEDAFCGLYGDRVLSTYRRMAAQQLGAACPTGLVGPGAEADAAIVADWLAEFERIQLMLRLSHRLRTKHGD